MIAAVLRPDFRRAPPLTLGVLPNPLEQPTAAARRKAGVLVAATALSDFQLGEMTGVHPRQVARWRAGMATPDSEQMLVLECLAPDLAELLAAGFALRIALAQREREEVVR